jgi:hypothetical protein
MTKAIAMTASTASPTVTIPTTLNAWVSDSSASA